MRIPHANSLSIETASLSFSLAVENVKIEVCVQQNPNHMVEELNEDHDCPDTKENFSGDHGLVSLISMACVTGDDPV